MFKPFAVSVLMLSMMSGFQMAVAETPSAKIDTLASSVKTPVLKNLDFKTVMMAFYQKKIRHISIPELDRDKVQYVGSVADDVDTILIFHLAEKYKNAANEERYLLTVSEIGVDADRKEVMYCGACAVQTDVYIFRKTAQGMYELISQASGENSWGSSGYNDSPYVPVEMVKQLKKIGPDTKGFVEEYDFSLQGYSNTTLSIAPFDEQALLKLGEVAEIHADNEATGSDETYHYDAEYKFLKTVHDGLYDIEIVFSGTQQDEKTMKIIPMKETHIYHYSAKKQKYARVK